jgi:hypothetical protein
MKVLDSWQKIFCLICRVELLICKLLSSFLLTLVCASLTLAFLFLLMHILCYNQCRNPGSSASSSSKSAHASEPNSEEEADGKRRRHGRGFNKQSDFTAAPKTHPISSEPRRIQADVHLSQALVRKLDAEKGIVDDILCSSDHNKNGDKSHSGSVGPVVIIRGLTSVKGLEGVEVLDTLVTYLWRIHSVDYYGMIETNEAKGFRHVRPERTGHEETGKSGSEW